MSKILLSILLALCFIGLINADPKMEVSLSGLNSKRDAFIAHIKLPSTNENMNDQKFNFTLSGAEVKKNKYAITTLRAIPAMNSIPSFPVMSKYSIINTPASKTVLFGNSSLFTTDQILDYDIYLSFELEKPVPASTTLKFQVAHVPTSTLNLGTADSTISTSTKKLVPNKEDFTFTTNPSFSSAHSNFLFEVRNLVTGTESLDLNVLCPGCAFDSYIASTRCWINGSEAKAQSISTDGTTLTLTPVEPFVEKTKYLVDCQDSILLSHVSGSVRWSYSDLAATISAFGPTNNLSSSYLVFTKVPDGEFKDSSDVGWAGYVIITIVAIVVVVFLIWCSITSYNRYQLYKQRQQMNPGPTEEDIQLEERDQLDRHAV